VRNFNETICHDVARGRRVKNKVLNEMWNKLRSESSRFLPTRR